MTFASGLLPSLNLNSFSIHMRSETPSSLSLSFLFASKFDPAFLYLNHPLIYPFPELSTRFQIYRMSSGLLEQMV